jgi:uncharacterized membrane protein required for colicin V production
MNLIDIIIVIIAVALSIRGYIKGFIHEVFMLGIVVFGFVGGFLLFRPLADNLQGFIPNRDLSLILSFFLVFIGIAVILIILRNALVSLVDRVHLTDIDYILGVAVGLVKSVLLSGVIFIFLRYHPILNLDRLIARSLLYSRIEGFFIFFVRLFPGIIEAFVFRVLGIPQ